MTGVPRHWVLSLALGISTGVTASAQPAPAVNATDPLHADLILTGGKIVTMDGADRIVEAVAVRDGHILAIGKAGDVAPLRNGATRVIELNGRTVLPGLIDAHSHVEAITDSETLYVNIQSPPLKGGAAIIAVLKQRQKELAPGAWIVGQGTYNQPMPTRAQLDAVFPDNPVRLIWSAHDSLINHRAAVEMGLTGKPDAAATGHGATTRDGADTRDLRGGHYERTPDGEVMIVRDAPAPWPKIALTYDEMKAGVRKTLIDFYLRKGVTTVSDLSSTAAYRAYQEMRDAGTLPVRLILSPFVRYAGPDLDAWVRLPLRTGFGDDWMRLGAMKLMVDGGWGTGVATYRPAWKGASTTWVPENYGSMAWTQSAIDKAVLDLHRAGWQIEIHANGDRAQDLVLNAYEAAQRAAPRPDARHRIEHFGNFLVLDPARTEQRLQRMIAGKIIPSPQVAFMWRLNAENLREPDVKFFPMKTLIDRGLQPAGGVDTGGTQNFATNPLFSIARAVRRDTKYGGRASPEEAIPVLDAFRMFTTWAARASFVEDSRGSIEPGKLADFAIFARDPLTADPKTLEAIPVDYTIVGGTIAYRRP